MVIRTEIARFESFGRILGIAALAIAAIQLSAGVAIAEDTPDAGVYEMAGAGWLECTTDQVTETCTWTGVGITQTHTRAAVGREANDQTLQQRVCVNVQRYTYPLPADDGGTPLLPKGGGGGGRKGLTEFRCETVPVGTFLINGLSSASLSLTTITLDDRLSCTEEGGCVQLPNTRDVTLSANWTSITRTEPFEPTHQRWMEDGCTFSYGETLQLRYAVADATMDGKDLLRDQFFGGDLRHGTYKSMALCH